MPAPTLRSWERRYGFPTPPRTSGLHRRYSRDEIELLRALRDEISRGRSARDAVEIVRRFGAQRKQDGREDLERFIDSAVRMDARAMLRLLSSYTKRRGVEYTIVNLALPALREIGVRWETGRCSVAHEHLATEQIENWLHRQTPVVARTSAPQIVIACGPEDDHRVGADAFAVLLARRGWNVKVLGGRVPALDLADAIAAIPAVAVVVTSHMKSARRSAVESLRALRTRGDAHLFYAGNAFLTNSARRSVPGTYLGEDLTAAADTLTEQLAAEAS